MNIIFQFYFLTALLLLEVIAPTPTVLASLFLSQILALIAAQHSEEVQHRPYCP